MSAKKPQLNVTIDPPEWRYLEKFEKQTGIPKVTLARAALYAALKEWQRVGSINFPLSISFRSDGQELQNNDELISDDIIDLITYEIPFLGAVAAGEPVTAQIDDHLPTHKHYEEGHFVVEINGRSAEPAFMDGDRWVIDGRDKFTPKNGAVCIVSDGYGSYIKKWNSRKKVFQSINPDFDDILPREEATLQGYPVEKLDTSKQ